MKIAWSILIGIFLLPGAAYAAGSEHGFGKAAGNCGGAWPLPDTGQTLHYSTATGDDSDYQPAAVQPRYTILNLIGTSSVTVDNITGLMWVTNPVDCGLSATYTWDNSLTQCEALGYATYTDWRLPNIKELQSIVDYSRQSPAIDPAYFMNTQINNYWSSTTQVQFTTQAWYVGFPVADVYYTTKVTSYPIRCVRGGQ